MPDSIRSVNSAGPIEVAHTEQSRSSSSVNSSASSIASAPADSADVSRAEALLATISAAAGQVPLIDEARVTELQAAIQSGTYQVEPQRIAEKLVEIERILSAKTGGG